MANVLFISEAFVKDNTLLHENIDFKFIRPVIMLSQDIHLQPKLLYWVQAEAPAAISYKFLNKGLMQQSSENSSTSSLDEINFISQKYKDKAEWYTERLVNFLLENDADYPAYRNPESGLDVIQPDTRTFTTGMFLGRSKRWTSLEDKYESKR